MYSAVIRMLPQTTDSPGIVLQLHLFLTSDPNLKCKPSNQRKAVDYLPLKAPQAMTLRTYKKWLRCRLHLLLLAFTGNTDVFEDITLVYTETFSPVMVMFN